MTRAQLVKCSKIGSIVKHLGTKPVCHQVTWDGSLQSKKWQLAGTVVMGGTIPNGQQGCKLLVDSGSSFIEGPRHAIDLLHQVSKQSCNLLIQKCSNFSKA